MKIYYFDNAATTKLDDIVFTQMLPFLSENYGNPSSLYKLGTYSKKAIENSRIKISKIINCKPKELYFTSGGSESDNTALKGIAHANRKKGNHIISSVIEHPAILESLKVLEKEGFKVTYLPVDRNGIINLNQLEKAITPNTILISIMFANNEIGTIEPIAQIGKIAKQKNVFFHTDAVQAAGALSLDVNELGVDALSISAHKFYGPKGIGCLYVKDDVPFESLISGGHQEREKRAGTENVASIVGMSIALENVYQNLEEHNLHLKELRDYFLSTILKRFPDIKINGSITNRLPGNINISFKNLNRKRILDELDKLGICASAGSACSAGILQQSHVLNAIGIPKEYSNNSLRITIGKYNTKEEVDYLITSLSNIVTQLYKES
ncbi:MAG: cysteine desulfurase [Clostridia bacterium]|nr:cysteine desulfurase [Clostridia bacterium]